MVSATAMMPGSDSTSSSGAGRARDQFGQASVVPGMFGPFWFAVATFMLMLVVLLTLRVELAEREATLDELYLAEED